MVTQFQPGQYTVSLTFASIAVCVASETGSAEIAQSLVALAAEVSEKSSLSSLTGVQSVIQVGKITSAICI